MQDRPSADELLAGIGELLARLGEELPRDRRFAALVAANATAILRRELAGADAERAAELERLSELLGRDVADADEARRLAAAAIRRGRFDEAIPEVAEQLRESVRAKLAVANPGWTAVADHGYDR